MQLRHDRDGVTPNLQGLRSDPHVICGAIQLHVCATSVSVLISIYSDWSKESILTDTVLPVFISFNSTVPLEISDSPKTIT